MLFVYTQLSRINLPSLDIYFSSMFSSYPKKATTEFKFRAIVFNWNESTQSRQDAQVNY